MKQFKNQNVCPNFKKYFKQYTEATGIHGIRYLSENRSPTEKIFWTFILLLSLGGCLVMITQIIKKYDNSPIVVSFATENTLLPDIPFPAVTICPESKSIETKFNYSKIYKKIFDLEDVNATEQQIFYYISLLCKLDQLQSHFQDLNISDNFFDIINELQPAEIINCSYMGTDCLNDLTPILTDAGICYSFNILDRKDMFKNHTFFYKNYQQLSPKSFLYSVDTGYDPTAGVDTYPKRGLLSGADNSLVITLVHFRYNTDFLCNKYQQGYKVQIHNPVDFPRIQKLYFHVPIGSTVVAAVEPSLVTTSEKVVRFKPETRKCYFQNERPLYYFKAYTEENCNLECQSNLTLQKCGCVSYFMPRNNSTRICGMADNYCIRNVSEILKIEEIENEISRQKCHCNCMPSCTSLRYNVETSLGANYLKEYFKFLDVDEFLDVENLYYSTVSVYFKVDKFIKIERNELYGIPDFISNFGGLLGLFTGFSLISAVEILYFATLRIFYNFRLFGRWFGRE